MAHRLNQLRTSTLTTRNYFLVKRIFKFYYETKFIDDQFASPSTTLTSSPRTPGKKLTKGDPIVTGIRLRPFLERFIIHFYLNIQLICFYFYIK